LSTLGPYWTVADRGRTRLFVLGFALPLYYSSPLSLSFVQKSRRRRRKEEEERENK